jgi:hypothetical protein
MKITFGVLALVFLSLEVKNTEENFTRCYRLSRCSTEALGFGICGPGIPWFQGVGNIS